MNDLPYEKLPFEKIGKVIRASANMESQLWSILSTLLNVDQFRARIITSSMPNLTQKLSLVRRLSNTYLSNEQDEKLGKMLDRVKRLSAKRNMLAHESMHINMAEDKNIVFKDTFDEKGIGFKAVEFPEKELDDLEKAISKITRELMLFVVDIDGKVFKDARIHREDTVAENE